MKRRIFSAILTVVFAFNTIGITGASASSAIPEIRSSPNATINTQKIKAGDTFDIIINVFDGSNLTNIFTLDRLEYDGLVLLASDINPPSSMLAYSTYKFTFRAPENSPRWQNIVYTISYSFSDPIHGNNFSGSKTFYVPVEVTDSPTADIKQPILENVKPTAGEILVGQAFEISGDIFVGADKITDAELTVNNGNTQLARRFMNVIQADTAFTLEVPGIDTVGNYALTVTLSYKDANGISRTLSKNVPVNVKTVSGVTSFLRLQHISHAPTAAKDSLVTANVHVTNPTAADIKGAIVSVYDDNNVLLASQYLQELSANSSTGVPLTFLASGKTGSRNYKVTIDYYDNSGAEHKIDGSFTLSINDSSAGLGTVRLQSVTPPFKAKIDSFTAVSLALTNSSDSPVKGVEAFLYDDTGKELTSVYISEINANSSHTQSLEFPVTGRTGTRTYSIAITCGGEIVNSSFSLTVVADDEALDAERPSSLRIQRVNAPAQIFTGVRTNVPFTLVNAGRGTAYNVEVYIVNESGEEIAREYVGTILASGSIDGVIPLRFDDPDNYNLTFYAVAENSDETTSQVSRAFETRAMNYRVTIADVSGHEWIWNNFTTIEFGVINGGSEVMLNTNAQLVDENDTVWGETYIGTIQPGEKKERIRFRDIYIDDGGMGYMELSLKIIYENVEMQEFVMAQTFQAFFQSDWGGGDWDPGPWPEDPWGDDPWGDDAEKGAPWAVIFIVSGVLLAAGIVVAIIVITKKKKKQGEDDDIDYFLSQMKMDSVPGSAAKSESYEEDEAEEDTQDEEVYQ